MITIKTSAPKSLLAAIEKQIDDDKVKTWSYDNEGDFTHTPDQWKNRAWLRPSIPATNDKLILEILWPQNTSSDKYTSGVYQGRFVEMVTNHFASSFSTVDITVP